MIHFFSGQKTFRIDSKTKIKNWLQEVAIQESNSIEYLNIILYTDEELLEINRKYLNHDYYTDVITFDHSDPKGKITADIYVSIERIRENSRSLNVPFNDEFHRVIVHGLLHLLGYSDKGPQTQRQMRVKEDFYLSLRSF